MSRLPVLEGRRARIVAPIAATMTALSLIAAGCGGDSTDSAGAAAAKAAGYVPSSAPLYVELSTDVDNAQWKQVETLAKVFPGYAEARADLTKSLNSGGVDFEKDVRPLLGAHAAVAVVSLPKNASVSSLTTGTTPDMNTLQDTAGDGDYLAVLELADGKEADAEALLKKNADGAPTTVNGTTVYKNGTDYAAVAPGAILLAAKSEDIKAALDAKAAGGDKVLSGSDRFTSAFSKLPDTNFATSYMDVGAITAQAAAANPQLAQAQNLGLAKDERVVSAATAESNGIRIKGIVVGAPKSAGGQEFSPTLTANVPGDAIAYVGFQNLQQQVADTVAQYGQSGGQANIDQVKALVPQIQTMLGITLDDLRALTTKEHALVVTKGAPVPGVTLALQVADGAKASATLDALRTKAPALLKSQGVALPAWKPVDLAGGVKGWDLPISPTGGVTYGVDGDLALIGSNPAAVKQVQRPVQPLSQSSEFTTATAGMPDTVTGVMWVNVADAVRLGNSLGVFKGTPKAYANWQKVKSISGWTTGGDEPTFEALVRIG